MYDRPITLIRTPKATRLDGQVRRLRGITNISERAGRQRLGFISVRRGCGFNSERGVLYLKARVRTSSEV